MKRPRWFTSGAWVVVKYTSPRSDRNQEVSGKIVEDADSQLTIEERDRSLDQNRVNDHRVIIVDTDKLEVHSETDNRETKLGLVTEVELFVPPWEEDMEAATGYSLAGHHHRQMVTEGVWKFPDPDFMDRPEDWNSED